jgi:hypothetical protein
VNGQTVILYGKRARDDAHGLIDSAPVNSVVTVKAPARTLDQNSKLWAMLSDVSRAKPEGRAWEPGIWKAAFLSALGMEMMWQPGIDGGAPFPAGYRSSRLTKAQMADLIELITEYGTRHGVRWSNEAEQ